MRNLMKGLGAILLIVLVFAVLSIGILLSMIFVTRIRLQRDWKQTFAYYESDFEIVNEYILSVCPDDEETFFMIRRENHEISSLNMFSNSSLHGTDILLEDKEKAAINSINDNAMRGVFDFIKVTSERIIYESTDSTQYVYSRNGEKIKYLDSPYEDKTDHFIFRLNDNWYLFYYL